jgi:saccharopine dehydrogenase (NAD+, L-lysine-forming)
MASTLANAHGGTWALYGATGVTGRIILERALSRGHRPTLIGRNPLAMEASAAPHGLASKCAELHDAVGLTEALRGHRLVLNAAGPFSLTAEPIIAAALAAGTDYLDVNGELLVLDSMLAMDQRARDRGVRLIGGVGFGVAAADGLVAQVIRILGGADALRISVAADSGFSSKAVAESTIEVLAAGGYEVDRGKLQRRRIARQRWFQEQGADARIAFASAPLAELAAARRIAPTARVTAGVPMAHSRAAVLSLVGPLLPHLLKVPAVRRLLKRTGGHAGGDAGKFHQSRVWVDGWLQGRRASARLQAGEGFAVAADIAVCAVEAALAKRADPGAHTPASAFGPDFITTIPGVQTAMD